MYTFNTKIRKSPFIAGVLLVTILGGTGLIALWLITEKKDSNSETTSTPDYSAINSTVSPVDNAKPDDASSEQTIQSIEDLGKLPSYFSRSVEFGKLLNEANFQQALNLLEESKQLSDITLRQSTQVEIFRRLASLEPELALAHTHDFLRVQRELYQSVVFQEWSSTDINSVVAYAERNLQEFESGEKIMILHSVLDSGHTLSDEVKQDIAKRFDLEFYFSTLEERARKAAMLEKPVEHWNLLLSDESSDLDQIGDLVFVALAVIENEGFDEFRTLHKEMLDRRIRNEVLLEVLRYRARNDGYESTFNEAVSLLDDTNRLIVFDIAERWFNQDAPATFDSLSQLEDEALREDLFETTALYLADRNPLRALKIFETLPESIRGVIVYTALFSLCTRDPIETAKHLSKITQYQALEDELPQYARNPPNRISNVARNLFRAWAEFDALAAFEWLLSDPTVAHIHDKMFFDIESVVTANNAEALIEIALKQPDEESNIDLEGVILSKLASIDFDKAKDLLPKMREGQARVLGYASIGAVLFYRDKDPDQSIEFGKQLPISEHADYYHVLAGLWAKHDATQTYAHIDLLPSKEAQARAASTLIGAHKWQQKLSEEQIEHLKSYLLDEEQGSTIKVLRSSSD